MIKISKMADYATVIMVYLGRIEGHATARQIADDTHIAWPTVCKILKLLVKKDLLCSTRGAIGGYGLAKAARDITLADILAAMEDTVAMTECAGDHSQCARQAQCNVSDHWRTISQVIHKALTGFSLADLIAPHQEIRIRASAIGLLSQQQQHLGNDDRANS